MHPECYAIWEENVMNELGKAIARPGATAAVAPRLAPAAASGPRPISNMWSAQYKRTLDTLPACLCCLCRRGYLRKDLLWGTSSSAASAASASASALTSPPPTLPGARAAYAQSSTAQSPLTQNPPTASSAASRQQGNSNARNRRGSESQALAASRQQPLTHYNQLTSPRGSNAAAAASAAGAAAKLLAAPTPIPLTGTAAALAAAQRPTPLNLSASLPARTASGPVAATTAPYAAIVARQPGAQVALAAQPPPQSLAPQTVPQQQMTSSGLPLQPQQHTQLQPAAQSSRSRASSLSVNVIAAQAQAQVQAQAGQWTSPLSAPIASPAQGVPAFPRRASGLEADTFEIGVWNGPDEQQAMLSQSGLAAQAPPAPAAHVPSNQAARQAGFDFFATRDQAASGNIFARRADLSSLIGLPCGPPGVTRLRLNAYNLKFEDDGPQGDDESKTFVLVNLTAHRATCVRCVLCTCALTVYDRYPLIDGTFFLSPVDHCAPAVPPPPEPGPPTSSGLPPVPVAYPVQFEGRPMFLHALCVWCMQSSVAFPGLLPAAHTDTAPPRTRVCCKLCGTAWELGAMLMVGSMYAFDLFAMSVCCTSRLACNGCGRPVIDPSLLTAGGGGGGGAQGSSSGPSPLRHFSYLSRSIRCPHCDLDAPHLVKPLRTHFIVRPASALL